MRKAILIIGGTGVFGKRLVRHLAGMEGITLFVSSRSLAKAQAFVETLPLSKASLQPIALDLQKTLKTRLSEIKPFTVIDCSGPFQGASFDTARAILQSGAHLIDLADARDYLANFKDALDGIARQNGVVALTGASSTPALSTCVATHLTEGWQRVDTIDICITPGGRSEVGRSVIEAILSYAGRDIPIWLSGRLTSITGWRRPQAIDIPGLGRRRVAAVETYDAEYLGERLNVQSRVAFSAGLESGIEQRGIEAIAILRKRGLLGRLAWLIPVLLKARTITRLPTSDAGGMVVTVSGLDNNNMQSTACWTLIARRDHGPFVPILAAAAALEELTLNPLPPGADLAHTVLALPDISAQIRDLSITTETSVTHTKQSIFEHALGGEEFNALPPAVSAFHAANGPLVWAGKEDIQAGQWFGTRLLARFFGFPSAGRDVPVTVTVDRTEAPNSTRTERWTRSFAGKCMTSVLKTQGTDHLTETFAPFTFTIPVNADADGITMPVSEWRIGRFRLPKVLAPRSETREYQDDQGRFRFDVRLSLPVLGGLVHYRGWLEPKQRKQAR